jgi:hypothetical protein
MCHWRVQSRVNGVGFAASMVKADLAKTHTLAWDPQPELSPGHVAEFAAGDPLPAEKSLIKSAIGPNDSSFVPSEPLLSHNDG